MAKDPSDILQFHTRFREETVINPERHFASYENLVDASQCIVSFDDAAEYRVFLGYHTEIEFPSGKSIKDT